MPGGYKELYCSQTEMCHEYNLMQFDYHKELHYSQTAKRVDHKILRIDYHKELHYEFKYNFFKLPYRALTVWDF